MMATTKTTADEERRLMPPPPPRPATLAAAHLPGDLGLAKAVLGEEDYTDAIAAIIERDYFPDIPKLKSQLEWMQAVKTGDPHVIRQAQINIARRRAGLATPLITPGSTSGQQQGDGWAATPGTALLRTPAMTPAAVQSLGPGATPLLHADPDGSAALPGVAAAPVEQLRAPPMSLDTFLATHTSEDNASFLKIHAKDHARKKQKIVHLLEDKNKPLLLEGPGSNPQEDYGSSGQKPFTLVPTIHNPKNALYYIPDQKSLSAREAEHVTMGPPRAINKKATRLKTEDVSGSTATAVSSQAASATATGVAAVQQHGDQQDYSRLSTPSLLPGAGGMSPLMTWGDIASTPLRLDPNDDMGIALDPNALNGPIFEIANQPKREQVGHELAAAKSLRELKKRQKEARMAAAMATALPPGAAGALASATPGRHQQYTPGSTLVRGSKSAGTTPVRGWTGSGGTPGRATPGASTLSAAAQKLARQIHHKKNMSIVGMKTPVLGGGDADRMLRASYSAHKTSAAATPRTGTRVGPQTGSSTPCLTPSLTAKKADGVTTKAPVDKSSTTPLADGGSITDDLLRI